MRLMIRAMIASSSLAAFSASVMKAGLGPLQGTGTMRPFGSTAPGGQAQPPVQLLPDTSKPAAPQGVMPRGSLLDLSV